VEDDRRNEILNWNDAEEEGSKEVTPKDENGQGLAQLHTVVRRRRVRMRGQWFNGKKGRHHG
jgi:hypothetical protein